MKLLTTILLLVLISVAAHTSGAHKHNSAKLEIVVNGNTIVTKLHSPGVDLFGFEGQPKTKEHKDNFANVSKLLNTEYNILSIEPQGHCSVSSRKLNKPVNTKSHTDYSYDTTYACKDISAITGLDLNLFRDIDSFKEVTVHLVNGSTQKEIKLNPTDSKFKL